MRQRMALELDGVELVLAEGDERPLGTRVLAGLVAMAEIAMAELARTAAECRHPAALVSRLRETRGVSSAELFAEMEREHPVELQSPFEGSDRVGGAVWHLGEMLGAPTTMAIAKLRWEGRAGDLPMHAHEHSDRFIIVASGRGYFHVTDESIDRFTGRCVRTIPARERDVFLFRRGVVHTFSTDLDPMILLSCQRPFLAFDDPRQYRLPEVRWIAADHVAGRTSIGCDAWTLLVGL